ncbi:MAG: hypothetical protein Q9173_005067 [Seirophora scorigena]
MIFIASIHWNNEAILRNHWNSAVLRLVEHLGSKNVFVSVLESGSWDDSKGALRNLDDELQKLGVARRIILEKTTHADEITQTPGNDGWIDTAREKKELRRIPYLSRLRNRSLEPLTTLAEEGTTFDRILFLNDVAFDTRDAVNLLSTRDGEYAAACSLDFAKAPHYYDTFALRDSNGDEAVISTYPYFRSSASRNALISGQPVPVQSCWNGIIAFDAAPFYHTPPLRFRGIPDSLARYHIEGSECCLVHADNPLTSIRGVWLNPNVRVGYSAEAYEEVHQRQPWPSSEEMVKERFRRDLKARIDLLDQRDAGFDSQWLGARVSYHIAVTAVRRGRDDLDNPETFGFLQNQVAQFYIQTSDSNKLYAWLIIPLKLYAKYESALLEDPLAKDHGIEGKLAFRLLTEDPGSRLVIYFHGNAGTVGQTRRTEAYRMVSSGASDRTFVLCFDYRGFGKSTGSPTEGNLVTDAICAIQWALEIAKLPPSRVVLVAQSLGTSLASAAACHFINQSPKIEFSGILLCAAFSDAATVFLSYSIRGVMPLLGPLRISKLSQTWFSRQIHDSWRTTDKITELVRKSSALRLTFVHAKNDHIIPWKQADSLFHEAVSATADGGLTSAEIDEKKSTTVHGEGGWIHKWDSEQKHISEIVVLHGGETISPMADGFF